MNCLLGETRSSTNSSSTNNSNHCGNNNITSSASATNTTNTNTNTTLNINPKNIGHITLSSQETCLICGDVASGKHYGLRSCEACKAFFKRTVQGKIEYSCPATRECEINKRRRKACQACRFQKCLDMGMLKEGVRLDRVRGGRQKYRRGLSPGPKSGIANSGGITGGGSTSAGCGESGVVGGGLVSGSSGQQNSNLSSLNTSETSRIMTALINYEPEEPMAFVTNLPSNLSVQMKTLYILAELFDRELVSLIGWAKQIPGFVETITLNDQMRLLQSTWAEVIALSIGYRSHLKRTENNTPSPTSSSPASTASSYMDEIRLVFAKDLMIDFKHAVACGAEEIFSYCVQLIKRLDHLKITPKEYIILKAISLTNADVRLENPKATHQLNDLIMNTLYEATSSMNQFASTSPPRPSSSIPSSSSLSSLSSHNNNNNNHHHHNDINNNNNSNNLTFNVELNSTTSNRRALINHRLNQVLLCLPVLRQIDSSIRKFWNDVRKGPNSVPMNKLFEEMLEPCQTSLHMKCERLP